MLSLRRSLFLSATLFFLSVLPSVAFAATYYVRADGTVTCAGKASATSASAASTALNMAQFNACTFSPGDTVYFSALGGNFTRQMTVPSSGTAPSYITYSGIDGDTPLIDVSASSTNSGGILVSDKSYVEVKNFQIKGSGGNDGLTVMGQSGVEGYTVTVRNVGVISNYGSSDATNDHDCFDISGSGQALFYNITAYGCRENPALTGSHQALTLHQDAKVKVYTARFGDSNYWIVNTADSLLEVHSLTASSALIAGLGPPGSATASWRTDIYDSTLTVNSGRLYSGTNGANRYATTTIKNSTIDITSGTAGYVFETLILSNDTINISVSSQLSVSTNGTLTMSGNTINLTTTSYTFSSEAAGAMINFYNNVVSGPSTAGNVFRFQDAGGGNIYNNIFKNWAASVFLAWLYGNATGNINFYNNTFYNSAKQGYAFRLGLVDGDTSGTNLYVRNNVFYNVNDVLVFGKPTTSANPSYNDYYNSSNEGGARSITSDPKFINPGTDFSLQSDSPVIDAGIDLGLTTDYTGNAIYGPPDFGAYEYQPPKVMGTNEPDTTAETRVYGDGNFHYTNSTGGTTANLSIRPIAAATTDFLDLTISKWNTSDDYSKSWTESSSTLGVKGVAHTIGDLQPGRHYNVKVDGSLAASSITGAACTNGVCLASSTGSITFTYTGGYSTKTFAIQEAPSSSLGAGGAANYWRRLYENGLAPPDFVEWWENGSQTSSSSSASSLSPPASAPASPPLAYVPPPRPLRLTPLDRKALRVRRLLEGGQSALQAPPSTPAIHSTARIKLMLDRVEQRRLNRVRKWERRR